MGQALPQVLQEGKMKSCLLARADPGGETSWEDRRCVRGWGEGSVVGQQAGAAVLHGRVTCGTSHFPVAVNTIQCCLFGLHSLCYGFCFRRSRRFLHFQVHLRAESLSAIATGSDWLEED